MLPVGNNPWWCDTVYLGCTQEVSWQQKNEVIPTTASTRWWRFTRRRWIHRCRQWRYKSDSKWDYTWCSVVWSVVPTLTGRRQSRNWHIKEDDIGADDTKMVMYDEEKNHLVGRPERFPPINKSISSNAASKHATLAATGTDILHGQLTAAAKKLPTSWNDVTSVYKIQKQTYTALNTAFAEHRVKYRHMLTWRTL
jgi:hypothetical protein